MALTARRATCLPWTSIFSLIVRWALFTFAHCWPVVSFGLYVCWKLMRMNLLHHHISCFRRSALQYGPYVLGRQKPVGGFQQRVYPQGLLPGPSVHRHQIRRRNPRPRLCGVAQEEFCGRDLHPGIFQEWWDSATHLHRLLQLSWCFQDFVIEILKENSFKRLNWATYRAAERNTESMTTTSASESVFVLEKKFTLLMGETWLHTKAFRKS